VNEIGVKDSGLIVHCLKVLQMNTSRTMVWESIVGGLPIQAPTVAATVSYYIVLLRMVTCA
jgi:hypothetical protein